MATHYLPKLHKLLDLQVESLRRVDSTQCSLQLSIQTKQANLVMVHP
jgi:hypothetical protein